MNRIHVLTLGVCLLATAALGQPLTLTYPGYSVAVSSTLENNPDAGFLPLVSARLDTLSRAQRDARFGILFRGAPGTPGDAVAFTFIDAATGATIRDMSMTAYTGGAAEGIQPLPDRSLRTDSTRVDAFTITGPAGSFTAVRTIRLERDTTMPRGSRLSLDWTVESATARQIRMVMGGRVEGIVTASGNALRFGPAAAFAGFRPQVSVVGPRGSQADVVPATQALPASVTLTGPVVNVSPGVPVSVFRLNVFGTTVTLPEHMPQQSSNVAARLNGATPAPGMVTRTFVGKPTALPGDTVVYRILFHNIGTGPATGVVLTNPIPDGVTYLAGSATGEDAEITIGESNPEPPQASVVQDITWTFLSKILPGDERWASFTVIVQ